MVPTLSPGAVGIRPASLSDAIAIAARNGFRGLEFDVKAIANDPSHAADSFRAAGVAPLVFGLPTDWRGDAAKWQESLKELPALAKAAAMLGCRRCATWILPMSDERDTDDNRRFHVERLKPVAEALGAEGISFGMEFVGPKTLRARGKYPFISTMEGMLDMGAEIGPNVGLLLDAFHWYTSHGTVEALEALKPEQVVYVHVNDGAPGRGPDEQIDNDRRLPGDSGVIDLNDFCEALIGIGYDGPIAVEPFLNDLNDLPNDDARAQVVRESLRSIGL
ncbi:sugar phosphate isomerase/epimerase [soil metagenome]